MPLGRSAINGLLRPIAKTVWGAQLRYHHAANGLVYDVTATLAEAGGETETVEGLTVPFHVGVFKVDRKDLPIMPQRLDRIEWIDPETPGRVEWFMVLSDAALDGVEPNVNFRDVWRIHAKWIPAGE